MKYWEKFEQTLNKTYVSRLKYEFEKITVPTFLFKFK